MIRVSPSSTDRFWVHGFSLSCTRYLSSGFLVATLKVLASQRLQLQQPSSLLTSCGSGEPFGIFCLRRTDGMELSASEQKLFDAIITHLDRARDEKITAGYPEKGVTGLLLLLVGIGL